VSYVLHSIYTSHIQVDVISKLKIYMYIVMDDGHFATDFYFLL